MHLDNRKAKEIVFYSDFSLLLTGFPPNTTGRKSKYNHHCEVLDEAFFFFFLLLRSCNSSTTLFICGRRAAREKRSQRKYGKRFGVCAQSERQRARSPAVKNEQSHKLWGDVLRPDSKPDQASGPIQHQDICLSYKVHHEGVKC